jgi:small neutral amino acid transporter SnatA (MarC family)
VIQTLFDFPTYFKFFIGLFALVNPVGIIPVFISMTSYQTAAARNKTNLTANLSVAIILLTSLFWATPFSSSSGFRLILSALRVGSWW